MIMIGRGWWVRGRKILLCCLKINGMGEALNGILHIEMGFLHIHF
jgi:hypothetical protein